MRIVILAAGIGSRLGNPLPKPLTPLKSGKTILEQQIENLSQFFNPDIINIVVGFKKDLVMEAFPDMNFIYNQHFDNTNTSKSLLKAIKKCNNESVLWLNGDVVFDPGILKIILPFIESDQSFVCVNKSDVGEEEVKYNLDEQGYIGQLSKSVPNAIGEALGINFISSKDIEPFIQRLIECNENDYFEKGIEFAIQKDSIKVLPIDISDYRCIEIDFIEDLDKANIIF